MLDGGDVPTENNAQIAAAQSNGVVVGSAIVRRIEDGKTPEARLASVRAIVKELRDAI